MRQQDTDVRKQSGGTRSDGSTASTRVHTPAQRVGRTSEWVGGLLGEWQRTELRIARGFAECRGLNTEQLEDLYQETALALLNRPYGTEEHLRNALRHGIKHRALNMHRDTRRRSQILAEHAPSMQRIAENRESQTGPEEATLAEQDRLIVREFLTELDELEQRVFWLIAEGLRYRAIASALEIPVNEARNASRSCERKRERFQLLYDTGRLCGYRAATIQSLQHGELTHEELARRAFAHLEACAHCRAEHKTNARRLGRSFKDQLVGLLPVPVLVGPLAWVRRWLAAGAQARGGMRDRATALIGTGGAGAKVTVGVVTAAVVAGGTIGATHALEHHTTRAHRHATARQVPIATEDVAKSPVAPPRDARVERASRHGTRRRPPSSLYVAASHGQTTSRPAAIRRGSAEREFSLESATGAPTNTQQRTSHSAEGGKEAAAEREFGG
jgi:RNA polymerase sigma factor (sigma-70 family)